jgi:NAD dependent epimerase/dehydratase
MKKILVTGAGGFIGSHLTESLVKKGYKVKAFVHYNSKNNWGWLETSEFKSKIEVISGDVRDYDFVFNSLKDCDSVFHLAALIGIPYSYISPMAYIKTNIEGTYNVLQSAKELGTKNVLITSTSETYGTAQYVPIDEKHPCNAQSPYAASKVAADQLALSFHRSFGMPVKIVRPFNTYGPRQSARAVIPTVITQILSGAKTIKLGNISPTRDLTYVSDTVEGFLKIAENKQCNGEAVNIGMDDEISIGDLASRIAFLMKSKVRIAEDKQRIRAKDSEVERLRCSNGKLIAMTGWRAQYDLDRGLNDTIKWLKANQSQYKADIYNV